MQNRNEYTLNTRGNDKSMASETRFGALVVLLLFAIGDARLPVSSSSNSCLACSLNGVCSSTSPTPSTTNCVCDPGWGGSDCGTLQIQPTPRASGYSEPNTSSWGGSMVISGTSASMFVSRITGKCGLLAWEDNSEVIRAVSPSGPV